MRAHRTHIERDFSLSPEELFAFLAEHENLQKLFGIHVTRVRYGSDGTRNGVGSARHLKIGPMTVEETVTAVVPNERIVYEITSPGPIRDHLGVQDISARPGGGSRLTYRIRFGSAVPGLAKLVNTVVGANIRRGLSTLEQQV